VVVLVTGMELAKASRQSVAAAAAGARDAPVDHDRTGKLHGNHQPVQDTTDRDIKSQIVYGSA
jgi:hypothetical protein